LNEPPGPEPTPLQTVQTRDVTLSYAVGGTGSPVVCVQGVGVAGSGWGPQVPALSHGFRVVTFDNRGIGRTARGRDPLSVDAMATDVWAIADAEGIERCHLVGHSMGGLIALAAALTRPARVKSLSLLCTFADGSVPNQLSWRMIVLGLRTRIGTPRMRRMGMLRMIFPGAWLATVDRVELASRLERLFGRNLAESPPIVFEQLRAMAGYNATGRLRELAGIPTLVISGRHDPIAPPAAGRSLADAIPGARYIEFADASHALPVQCADRVNALLHAHLTAADSE
jgi:pimeloyl-ACP methyl ester carboxylesterase